MSEIAMLIMDVCLFSVSNRSLLLPLACFFSVLWLNNTSYSKCLKRWTASPLLWTWRYNFQPPRNYTDCHNTQCYGQTV